jgi:hypothetical protein
MEEKRKRMARMEGERGGEGVGPHRAGATWPPTIALLK